jgi:NADPH:quinone reductase-like Zn-dependent oxidoreductase
MVTQLAERAGCQVIGLVADQQQAERLPVGVEGVTSADDERLRELRDDRTATLLVDTLGGPDLLKRAGWVRAGGRAVVIGYVTGTHVELDLPNWLLEDVALMPVNMMRQDRRAREYAADLAKMVTAGDLRLDVETFELEQAAEALHELSVGGLRGRAVLVPGAATATS